MGYYRLVSWLLTVWLPSYVYIGNNHLTYVLTTAKLNSTGLIWVADLANFKFKIHYRSGIKNKKENYLSRFPLHEIEQLQKVTGMIINSDNISLCNSITSAHKNPYIDISVLQLNSVDNITSVKIEKLSASQLHDDHIKLVYQFIKTKIKPCKQEWKEISY